MLEVNRLSVHFGGLMAVHHMSLHCDQGDIVGLIGPNGAGKTTLLNAISGFVPVAAGSITLDGMELSRLSAWRRARVGVARTFQVPRLFSSLVLREQLKVLGANVSGRARDLLDQMDLRELLDANPRELPHGYQRLAEITRAVSMHPKLLMLDEPITGLTSNESNKVQNILQTLAAEGLAILLVEHNLHLISALCKRVYVMHTGAKLAEGSLDDILKDERVKQSYLGDTSWQGL